VKEYNNIKVYYIKKNLYIPLFCRTFVEVKEIDMTHFKNSMKESENSEVYNSEKSSEQ